jgi:hypothetical protein
MTVQEPSIQSDPVGWYGGPERVAQDDRARAQGTDLKKMTDGLNGQPASLDQQGRERQSN